MLLCISKENTLSSTYKKNPHESYSFIFKDTLQVIYNLLSTGSHRNKLAPPPQLLLSNSVQHPPATPWTCLYLCPRWTTHTSAASPTCPLSGGPAILLHRLPLVRQFGELRPPGHRGSVPSSEPCPRDWTSSLMQPSIPYLFPDAGPVLLLHRLLIVHRSGELRPPGQPAPPLHYRTSSHEVNPASPTCHSALDQFSSLIVSYSTAGQMKCDPPVLVRS